MLIRCLELGAQPNLLPFVKTYLYLLGKFQCFYFFSIDHKLYLKEMIGQATLIAMLQGAGQLPDRVTILFQFLLFFFFFFFFKFIIIIIIMIMIN